MTQLSSSNTLGQALKDLKNTVDILRQLGLNILNATILNLVLTIGALALRSSEYFVNSQGQIVQSVATKPPFSPVLSTCAVIVGLVALFCILNFDSSRKQGNALFEEIVDEYQWLPHEKADSDLPYQRPDIEVRLALRTFVQRADLPLVPGKFGPMVYAFVHISLMILSWIPTQSL